MATWTDEDFRLLFAFIADMGSVLQNPSILDRGVCDLLRKECQEASACLSRIAEAVGR